MFMSVLLVSPVFKTVVIVVVALVLLILVILNTWKKVPNDHAAVIVGTGKPKVVTGGGVFVIPLLQRMDMITLETLSLNVNIQNVKTSLGVPINADGYVILKVKADNQNILTAMQMFYCNNENSTKQKIVEQVQSLCEGKLREIVSTMTVEEIYDDREKFSASVTAIASKALNEIGLELKSFTINDITDNDDYIVSLGRAQIAKVKAEASIAEAEARKEQEIKTAEAEKEQKIRTAAANKEGEMAKLLAETEIAEAQKAKQLKMEAFRSEQETKKAEADAAYKIQENITSKQVTSTQADADVLREQRAKEVREAEIQIEIAAEQKRIELAQKKADRKEAELQETVVKPAEAARKETEINAEAAKIRSVKGAEAAAEAKKLDAAALAEAKKLDASAEAELIAKRGEAEATAIKAKGEAEAEAIKAKGLAEAEALEKKAEALAKMNEAGKLQMVMDILPEFARAVAEPMAKIGNVTVIGGGSDGSGVDSMTRSTVSALKAVTDAVKDTVGFDLTKVMEAQTIDAQVKRDINVSGIPENVDVTINNQKNKSRPTSN